MNENEFWSIIALLDWGKSGKDDAVIEPVVAALAEQNIDVIKQFDEILAEKLHALDTEAHAREIGEEAYRGPDEYFSPDWFLYVRCCVVANGREAYAQVLANPQDMPKDMEFEAILYVAANAYERKTGKEYDHVPAVDYETFQNRIGWKQ